MLSWATPKPLEVPRRMAADRVVYLVSDIHLGDGTPSDTFMGKDREFIEFLRRARAHDAHLVVAGDIIDFHQAFAMSRVLKAHGKVIGELSRYASDLGVTYIWGNHDHDISLFRDLLAFDVCSRLEIGDDVLVQHGYEYDPWIGPHLEASHLATQFHHMVERLLHTWIRLPLQNFYNRSNRLFFWLTHKTALLLSARIKLQKALGMHEAAAKAEAILTYWARNQMGDAAGMFRFMRDYLVQSPYKVLVTGHSHLPGKVEVAPGKTYVNTGSWTFNSTSYVVFDKGEFVVRDWLTGQTHGDRAYRQLVAGSFDHVNFLDWWQGEYLGWFRFRVGEQPWRPRLTSAGEGDDNRPAPLG